MAFLYALRYFQIVAVVPPLFIAGFLVTVAAGAIRLAIDPAAAVDALTPVLLLQVFAASSGFQIPARRGYYDLLLTSGATRWQIAVAHCVASTVPGIASWMCVAMLETAASYGERFASVAQGTCLAFVAVSLIAWATAMPMSRATSAVGWLLVMTIPPLAGVASPVQLLGAETVGPLTVALPLALATTIAVGISFTRIVRGTVPLEAAQ